MITQNARQGTTKLAPPAPSAAEVGRANLVYKMYNNKLLPPTATGLVRLAFDYRPSSQTLAKEIIVEERIDSSQKAQSMIAVESTVQSVVAGTVISRVIQPESEAMFIALIEQAVKNDDYKKAMRFVEEAERAGSSKARDALFDAAKKHQQQTDK